MINTDNRHPSCWNFSIHVQLFSQNVEHDNDNHLLNISINKYVNYSFVMMSCERLTCNYGLL